MAKHRVQVDVKATDRASRKFKAIGFAAGGMGSMLKKAALAAGVYFGGRALYRQAKSSLALYAKQESAVKGLYDALSLLGPVRDEELKDLRKYASAIQELTKYGDEQILELMAMGSAMGKLSGGPLKKATIAAIGLAKAYKIELAGSMRLVARAAVGDTASLTRYGIKLEEGLDAQEKFNKVLEIGVRNFELAKGEVDTYAGSIAQMKNAIGDVKEQIGKALMPTFRSSAVAIKNWSVENQESIGLWAAKSVSAVTLGKDIFWEFVKFMKDDWQKGFQVGLDLTLTSVEVWGKQLIVVMEKIFTDLYNNVGVWIRKAVAENLEFSRIERKFIEDFWDGVKEGTEKAPKSVYLVPAMGKEYAQKEIERLRESGFFEAKYPKRESRSWASVGAELKLIAKEALADFAGRLPPELAKGVNEAFAKYQVRLAALQKPYMPSGTGSPAIVGGGGAPQKQPAGGIRAGLQAVEARFLTMSAHRQQNPTKEIAQNTSTMVKILNRHLRVAESQTKAIERVLNVRQTKQIRVSSMS